jgi:hypothetical protein
MDQSLLSIEQASQYIGMTQIFLRRRCNDKAGNLRPKFYRLGGRLKFRKEDLDTFVQFYEGASHANSGNKDAETK